MTILLLLTEVSNSRACNVILEN